MRLNTNLKYVLPLLSAFILFIVACDGNKFETIPNEKCFAANNSPNTSGEFTEDGTCIYKHFYKTGKIDVVFVIDNSKSMYVDQQKLAQKFPKLVSSIWDLDFKLGILTTDIYASPGQFMKLSNGQYSITNTKGYSQSEVNSIFTNSITRPETLSCELSANNCPSGDVRGIYAVNLAITKSKSFFRPDAHLAVITITDADVRVFGGSYRNYELDNNWDTAESLVKKVGALNAAKTMSFHSIIINPGDESLEPYQQATYEQKKDVACFEEQKNQGDRVRGYYGREYYKASVPSQDLLASGNILKGTVGSICDTDYSNILYGISNNVKSSLKTVGLRCKNPINVDVYYTSNIENKIPFHISSNTIVLDANISPGSDVTIEMECPNLH